jgi:myosin-5
MTTLSKVFIPDKDHVWLSAEVLSEEDEFGVIQVRINDSLFEDNNEEDFTRIRSINLRKNNLTSLPLQNIDFEDTGVDDMVSLPYLHEASILDNLRRRFLQSIPYTYTGEICIAVNPYKWLDIYTDSLRNLHLTKQKHELSPHVYSTSSAAYRGLRDSGIDQSILVSGESGAGKTETVKILMDFIAGMSMKKGDLTIEKVLKASPLLESFGNAKTIRNDNSSRFGKFTQLNFDSYATLVGCKCVTYLLEKSRVVSQNEGDRNYHIMYQILNAPIDARRRLKLDGKGVVDFIYTNNGIGDVYTSVIEGVRDENRYSTTMNSLDLLGVSLTLRNMLEESLSGILYLGQTMFLPLDGDEDKATVFINQDNINCYNLLGITEEEFKFCCTSRTIDVEGKKLSVPLSVDRAVECRDALAKELYSRLFQWLVVVINFNTNRNVISNLNGLAKSSHSNGNSILGNTISLLDIFGFELFAVNRFEQFCINWTNEKLQQKFTQDVFKSVQIEYIEEGLEWENIGFVDNQDTLDIIEGRRGVISCLNEECMLPQSSDNSFLSKAKSSCSSHPSFSNSLVIRDEFCISHYAGKVSYSVTGFLDRNKDNLPDNMKSVMVKSSNPLISSLFDKNGEDLYGGSTSGSGAEDLLSGDKTVAFETLLGVTKQSRVDYLTQEKAEKIDTSNKTTVSGSMNSPKKGRRNSFYSADTVTTKFKSQLSRLMNVIGITQVQYVRCIKPNNTKSSLEFVRLMVVEQLRSAGMVEAIRISRASYPYRMLYSTLLQRFRLLKKKSWHDQNENYDDLKYYCSLFIKSLLDTENKYDNTIKYVLGKTKCFFVSGVLEMLESQRSLKIYENVKEIQKIIRGRSFRKKFIKMRYSIIIIQKNYRMTQSKNYYNYQLFCILAIQCIIRIKLARLKLIKRRYYLSSIKIQSCVRKMIKFKEYKKFYKYLIMIQSIIKMFINRKCYIVKRDASRYRANLVNKISYLEELLLEKTTENDILKQTNDDNSIIISDLTSEKIELEDNLRRLLVDYEKKITSLINTNTNFNMNTTISASNSIATQVVRDGNIDKISQLEKELEQRNIDMALQEKEIIKLNKLLKLNSINNNNSSNSHQQILTPIKQEINEENSEFDQDFVINKPILRVKARQFVLENITTSKGISCILFLSSGDTTVIEKKASIRFKTGLILISMTNTTKKMTIELDKLSSIRKGFGKSILLPSHISCTYCIHVYIKDKGELNIIFDNELIRDEMINYLEQIKIYSPMKTPTSSTVNSYIYSNSNSPLIKANNSHFSPLVKGIEHHILMSGWIEREEAVSNETIWIKNYIKINRSLKQLEFSNSDQKFYEFYSIIDLNKEIYVIISDECLKKDGGNVIEVHSFNSG